ncbi:MAG: type II secretion system F family protein [Deltaproteobacteria bacterium]|nr:type II secretion system F family protein [Deltaproteobacteria bacterium]
MSSEYFSWLIPAFTAVGMMFVTFLFLQSNYYTQAMEEAGGPNHIRRKSGWLLNVFGLPIGILAAFIALLPVSRKREALNKKLIAAGRPGGLNADEFAAMRVLALVIGCAAGNFIDSELGFTPIITLAISCLGFFYPDIWLRDAIEKRKRRIFRDLPDVLDTLRLAVDAGLDLSSAMKVVVEKGLKSPLIEELEDVEREMSLGRTRREALKGFADRIGMTEITALVLALVQADQLGASIGPILQVQADMSRQRRWQLAETIVNKMPLKMMAPLVLLIFPASFIILFTPIVIQWLQSK